MSKHANSTRALPFLPALSITKADLAAWGLRAAVVAFFAGAVFALTSTRMEATRLRYQLNELTQRRAALSDSVKRLNLELSTVARPQRIEQLARGMGLGNPRSDQVMALNE